MKLVKAKTKKKIVNVAIEFTAEIEQYIIFAYLFCMLGIFPLFYKEQYYKIGDAKFEFFWKASLLFVAVSFLFLVLKVILYKIVEINLYKGHRNLPTANFLETFLNKLSFMDYAVLIYGICVLLSFEFSDYKDYAIMGAAGWQMGLCSQLIFIALYFLVSRQKDFFKIILGVHMLASALAFVFGILHRFDMDPLGMYVGLNLNQKIEFLSTIGQATWFSGYVCTTFAIGLVLFYISNKKWVRIMSGIYSVISFGILVTQNSDSAFVAIAGILLLLGYFSLNSKDNWCRFLQIISFMWITFVSIGILQRVFADRAIPLDTLSTFFSQSAFSWIMLMLSFVLLFLYSNDRAFLFSKDKLLESQKNVKIMKITKRVYQGMLLLLVIAVVGMILFIYLNTKGYLLQWFGYQSSNQYLLFDYHWGSNRGSTWMICWQAFLQMPFYQKLFGIGPDSLSQYLYSIPDISDLLHLLWGNLRLTNAHNEYLNCLLNLGIVGLAAWLGVLIGGAAYFYEKAKENSFLIAFALSIVGYACHNIFCYQQVCATPILFIVLGVGESLTKSPNFNTIK